MRSKQYVEQHLDAAQQSTVALINDLDNNREYVTKDYILSRLEYINKVLILTQDRITLEDENP